MTLIEDLINDSKLTLYVLIGGLAVVIIIVIIAWAMKKGERMP